MGAKKITLEAINFNYDQIHLQFNKWELLEVYDNQTWEVYKNNWIYKTIKFCDIQKIFQSLNSSNTPDFNFDYKDFSFNGSLNKINWYHSWIIFKTSTLDNKTISAFHLNFGKKQGIASTPNEIVIYSTFIQYLTNLYGQKNAFKFLKDFILDNFDSLKICMIPRRLDLCFDIPTSKKEIYELAIKNKVNFTTELNKTKRANNIPQTMYIGNKTLNPHKPVLRIYDKILDSTKKGKMHLYPFFKGASDVTRLEIEFNAKPLQALAKNTHILEWDNLLSYSNFENIKSLFKSQLQAFLPFIDVLDFKTQNFEYSRSNWSITTANLKEYYAEMGQLPHYHQTIAPGIIKKVREATWPRAILNILFADLSEKEQKELSLGLIEVLQNPNFKRKVKKKTNISNSDRVWLLKEISEKIYKDDVWFNYFNKSLHLGKKKEILD